MKIFEFYEHTTESHLSTKSYAINNIESTWKKMRRVYILYLNGKKSLSNSSQLFDCY